MDRFGLLFDVAACEARRLPLLAQLIGLEPDSGQTDPETRRRIRDAAALYRRKATPPAIGQTLTDLGWQGRIQGTYPLALRLNRRARLDGARLPGLIYRLGVWCVVSELDADGLRAALAFHHPAGTQVYLLQRLANRSGSKRRAGSNAPGESSTAFFALNRRI